MPGNGTAPDISSPMRTGVLFGAGFLCLLFTVAKPEATHGLDLAQRLLFWLVHVGLGVTILLLVSDLILRKLPPLPRLFNLLLTGLVGAFLAAPFYYWLDTLFATTPPTDWLDELEQQGLAFGILAEFLCALPLFLLSWLALNLPLLLSRQAPNKQPGKQCTEHRQATESRPLPTQSEQRQAFFNSLPEVVGNDLITISSDLHYLKVHTTQGYCLVVGSVSRCADFLEGEGIQVHRANWVAKKHVVKVHISGEKAYCLMSNGLKVSISRSRRKAVRQLFGSARQHQASTHSALQGSP